MMEKVDFFFFLNDIFVEPHTHKIRVAGVIFQKFDEIFFVSKINGYNNHINHFHHDTTSSRPILPTSTCDVVL